MGKRGLLILTALVALLLTSFQVGGAALPSHDPYHPATYGLPEVIAGYQVVMVLTYAQNMCMPEDQIHITLQAVEPDMQQFLQNQDNRDLQAINKEHPNWTFIFVGPAFNREEAIKIHEEWNASSRINGCIQLGPIPEPITPTP